MNVLRLVLLFVLSVFGSVAFAQSAWPLKVVKIVVPYPGGGEADFLARVLAQKMTEKLGQAVIVENRPGATGNIGTEYVAKSQADGYTLLLGSDIQFAISPAIGTRLPYDPDKSFDPVSIVVLANLLVLSHPSLPVKSVQDLVALAKASPGKINFATTGPGGNDHLGIELLMLQGGFNMTHVPYKGQGTALPDLVAGQVQVAMFGIASTLPHVKAGRLKALAVTSPRRLAILPEVPTVSESGFPGFEATLSWGLYAPAGTPASVISVIHDEVGRIVQLQDVRERLASVGQEPIGSTPSQAANRMRTERAKWAKVIREAGIRIDP